MIATDFLFLLLLFVVRSNSDCILQVGIKSAMCTGFSFDSFTNIGENCWTIRVNNPPRAVFVVNKSKNHYLRGIVDLDISNTGTLLISDYGFKDLVSLFSLNLNNCSIESLKSTWFLVNNNITKFDCSDNKLRTLFKSDLENLRNLEVADFSNNLLESIEPHAFSEMKDLWRLNLSGNKLKSIPTGHVPNLRSISLEHNLIDVIPANAFTEIRTLRRIYLGHNAIRKIEDGAFKGQNRLSTLILSNNFIEEITEFAFSAMDLHYFEDLDLSSNKIFRIAPGAFKEMPILRSMNFSNNLINELNEDIFEGLDAVRLYLDHNVIERIGSNTFRGFKSLTCLYLGDNKLSSFTAEMFGTNLSRLLTFSIRNNRIQLLDSEFFKFTPYIEYFHVSFNKLQFLPEDIFVPLKYLARLTMQNNLIEELTEAHIESLKSLTFLSIEHNKLTFIPLNRDSFPNLTEMRIGGNPWQCPCLHELQNFLNEKKIKFIKKYYFDWQCPVCVPTYFEHCEKIVDFAKFTRIPETYKVPHTEECRIKYLSDPETGDSVWCGYPYYNSFKRALGRPLNFQTQNTSLT